MRRSVLSLLLAGVALTGCSNFRDLFSAHADVAAEAGALELPAQRLAEMISGVTKGPRQRVSRETADFITDTWVDYALFAQAVARNQLPLDSVSVAEAVWPELAELKGTHFHDTLMTRRAAMSDSAADSLYGTDVRVLQQMGGAPARERLFGQDNRRREHRPNPEPPWSSTRGAVVPHRARKRLRRRRPRASGGSEAAVEGTAARGRHRGRRNAVWFSRNGDAGCGPAAVPRRVLRP